MPLPTADSPWPPPALTDAHQRITTWSAWYSSDPAQLAKAYERYTYGAVRPSERPAQRSGGVVGKLARFWWGQPTSPGQLRTKVHIPIAADMAATSADLLFSEPMTFEATDAGAQKRLDTLTERAHATILEGAEVAAGLGGVYLRAPWDRDFDPDGPWLDTIHADAALPEWRYGRLAGVTFWRVIAIDGKRITRHLERHEAGVVEHAVFEGSDTNLGREVALTRYPDTKDLTPAVETGIGLATATYVPNMRPNRLWRGDPIACHLGRSDYAGVEPLMDSLDEVASAKMRDVRLGKARAFVPSDMLRSNGPGQGAGFDDDQEYYVPVQTLAGLGTNSPTLPITMSQPEIRYEAFLRIELDLISRIVGTAGYSGQTFGLVAEGEGAATATETAARTRKSLITRDKKGLYWLPELAHMAQVVLQLGNRHFAWGVSEERPRCLLPDAVQPTQRELAETAEKLKLAEAASIETRVRMVNSGWADKQVEAEVQRIRDEIGASTLDPAEALRNTAATGLPADDVE